MSSERPTAQSQPAGDPAPGWIRALLDPLRGVDPGAVVILISAALILVLFRANGTAAAYNRNFGQLLAGVPWRAAVPNLYWFGCSLLAFVAAPLLIARLGLRLRPVDLGLGLGDWRSGLKIAGALYLFMLPFVVGASFFDSFVRQYPLSPYVASQAVAWWQDGSGLLWIVLLHELGYAIYFVGWELLFRGYLTLALARYIGPLAVFVQLLPFVILHVGKPQPEALGSIVAGVALGVLALRTRSMLWGCLLHIAIALTMDLLALAARVRLLG